MEYKKALISIVSGGLLISSGLLQARPVTGDFIKKYDQNNDGQISLAEFNQQLNASFSRIDSDGNGRFDKAEFLQYSEQKKAEYKKKKMARHADAKQRYFNKLDKNSDGVIAQSEYMDVAINKAKEKAAKRFAELDSHNSDGNISQAEFMQGKRNKKAHKKHGDDTKKHRAVGKKHNADKMFSRMDSDNNGEVTPKENRQSRIKWFNKLDADNNGLVNADELKQAHSARRKK